LRAKTLYGEERRRFIEDLEDKLRPNVPASVRDRMLTWEQVREMYNAGIQFGSHTVTHTILSRIPRSEMLRELRESKTELSERLGTTISTFAYPNGGVVDYNAEAKSALRECGYSCGVTCCSGSNYPFSDAFELKRGLPWQKEIDVFRFKFFLQRHGLAS
jgi:peptidoglycan/xylan/chitin deacetylase (PgdA/CDA1 family)